MHRATAPCFPLAVCLLIVALPSSLGAGFDVIPADGPLPTIWLPEDPVPQIERAANDLAETLADMAGRQPPPVRIRGSTEPPARGIHLGAAPPDPIVLKHRPSRRSRPSGPYLFVSPAPVTADALPEWEDPHGVRAEGWTDTWFMDARGERLYLWGHDDPATVQAIYWFLQHHGEVHWYLPGPLGRVVPRRNRWSLPEARERAEPGYLARLLRMDRGETPEGIWARRNLLREHFDYNHNMHRVVRAEDFDSCPECFPVLDGERHRPRDGAPYLWQPNLLSPEVVRRTTEHARTRFDANPRALSCSISLNDNIHFGDYPSGVDPRKTGRTFRSHYDYSNLVFAFSNRVADRVARSHSDRYLGALAYAAWENTPDFAVAPNIVPYLTADRSQWYDAEFRSSDLALVRAWVNRGPRIVGTWDYAYGSPFVIPRLYLGATAESLAALHTAGVRAYSAELNPHWGYDAPKAWLSAQLLVNPRADPDALMERFFTDLYGPAAPSMRRFFDACESIWMNQSGPARWIKFYLDSHQATLFPPATLEDLDGILSTAEARAETALQRDRIAITRRALEATRTFVAMQQASWDLSRSAVSSATDAGTLDSALVRYARTRAAYSTVHRAIESDPHNHRMGAVRYPLAEDPVPRVLIAAMNTIPAGAPRGRPARDWKRMLNDVGEPEWQRFLGQIADGSAPGPNLLRNPHLEAIAEEPAQTHAGPEHWQNAFQPVPALRVRSTPEAARSGSAGIEISGASGWQIAQPLPVEPNTRYSFSGWARGFHAPSAGVTLRVRWYDANGAVIRHSRQDRLPPGDHPDWFFLAVADESPGSAAYALPIVTIKNQAPGNRTQATDFAFQEWRAW